MSNHAVMPFQDYVDACEAIREITGSINVIKSGEMASGVNEVYEAGKKAEYDEFWDSYQDYGTRRYYKNAFSGNCWNEHTFRPKYDIIDTSGQNVFQESLINVDLREHLNNLGIKLDTSGVKHMTYYFYASRFTALPEISTVSSASVACCFQNAVLLKTIDKLIFKEDGSQTLTNTFTNASRLEHLEIEGAIGKDISFSYSPLTVESMVSIITHLKDYSGTENAGKYTLTLKDTCKTLMAEQGEIAEFGGKTYDAYIADIGWNLA